MRNCENGCPGPLRPTETSPTFTRRNSKVEVTIYHVPAEKCSVCGQEFLTPETSVIIDQVLEPYHGHGVQVPDLPPAKVLMEFPVVAALSKAA